MPVRLLFVCYENICRSPMAEGLFRRDALGRGLSGHFEVASAGTVCFQSGSSPDPRAVRAAARHGIDISGQRAQCIDELDLGSFDLVVAMDEETSVSVVEALGAASVPVVRMMTEFCPSLCGQEIEDPYYGPESGFDHTLSLLAACVGGLLDSLAGAAGLRPGFCESPGGEGHATNR